MLDKNYCKMIFEMNSLNSYSYSITGDFTYSGSLNTSKVHYNTVYSIDFDLLQAHITINMISSTTLDTINLIFNNCQRLIKSTSSPNWNITPYSKSDYVKLFIPGGYLDLFNFSNCYPANLISTNYENGILFDNISISPNIALIMGFSDDPIDIISSSSTETIYVNSSNCLIDFIKSNINVQGIVNDETISITGSNIISLLGLGKQVNLNLPTIEVKSYEG